jgi:predicted ribosome quality control (RQC) complex YloA/Tae2 family protein
MVLSGIHIIITILNQTHIFIHTHTYTQTLTLALYVQDDERHVRLHQQLTSALQNTHKKLCSKIRTFEAQMADVAKVDAVQKNADMITANIYRIPAGRCGFCPGQRH